MKLVLRTINEKLAELSDETDWLNSTGESYRYNFKGPVMLAKYFDRNVDTVIWLFRDRVDDQLREEQRVVYTNVYWEK